MMRSALVALILGAIVVLTVGAFFGWLGWILTGSL